MEDEYTCNLPSYSLLKEETEDQYTEIFDSRENIQNLSINLKEYLQLIENLTKFGNAEIKNFYLKKLTPQNLNNLFDKLIILHRISEAYVLFQQYPLSNINLSLLNDKLSQDSLETQNAVNALLLIKMGANPNITNSCGTTLLHVTVFNSKFDLTQFLLEKGANPTIKNKKGFCAIDYTSNIEMCTLLMEYSPLKKSTTDDLINQFFL